MELRDLVVTPLLLIILGVGAIVVRPYFTDELTRRYFLPAFWCKVIGALALGFLYQYYYAGGDTYNYHTHGSRIVWNTIIDSPSEGLQLLFGKAGYGAQPYKAASRILFITDPSSYFVVRIAAILDLFTFSTYSATALLFSVFSFAGSWMLFKTFYSIKPELHKLIAIATLFIPSMVFWGSGLLKDTLTLGALGLLTYGIKSVFIDKRKGVGLIIMVLLSTILLFEIKRYIILCYLPAALIWIYIGNLSKIRSMAIRIVLLPIIICLAVLSAYFSAALISKNDERYSLDKLAKTAQITAYDIRYYTGKDAGSGYQLGELDGSFSSMLRLAPAAVNVSLFRPYLWEVRNPLMLLSAMESFIFLVLTIYVLVKLRWNIVKALSEPNIIFCLIFSIAFAFAVGVATFNFGTLARYKIPLLPFYSLALIFLIDYLNRERKTAALESTE